MAGRIAKSTRVRRSKEEAAQTRERIIKAAATAFRDRGLSGTSLSDIMSAVGLTHGGFYRHFQSKDDLAAAAIAAASSELARLMAAGAEGMRGRAARVAMLDNYLSLKHWAARESGCPLAALASELASGPEALRAAAAAGFERLVELMAGTYLNPETETSRRRANVVVGSMIGALTTARLIDDEALASEALEAARSMLADL